MMQAINFSPHLCFNNLTLVSSNGLEEHSAASMSTGLSKR